jgi:hypothetical protein
MVFLESSGCTATTAFLMRVKGEYAGMPGLRLTPEQAARLWSVDAAVAAAALQELADSGYLWRRFDGSYALTDGGSRTCAWFVDR